MGLLTLTRKRGGGGAPSYTYATWNPADKHASVILSNNDLTAEAAGGWLAARATVGVITGDWFFQEVFDSGSYAIIAVSASDGGLTYPGDSGNSWGISSHGYSYYPGGYTSNGVTFSAGDIFGCSILRSTSQAKFYKYNTGTESWDLVYTADISAIDASAAYPMFSGFSGTATANFGQSAFAAAVPDGCNEGVYS